MSGWIKLDRDINKHWIFSDPWKFRSWIDLLLLVNHKESKANIKGKILTCKRGETLCSLDTLSKRWKVEKSKVRRFLKLLESDHMIDTVSEQVTTRITICNYDSYQQEENANETQTKRKRNGSETHLTPNKNDKNEKNNNIPTIEEFICYAIEKKPNVNTEDVRLKFHAWNDNDWVDGNGSKILNWKSKLSNSIKYFREQIPNIKSMDDQLYENVMRQINKQ